MLPSPGALSAFKPSAAASSTIGVKPQQVGGVKFPGKINPAASAAVGTPPKMKLASPTLPVGALENPALGAMLGLLFGRIANRVPGLSAMLSNPLIRDAALGAAVAQTVKSLDAEKTDEGPNPFNATMTDPRDRGWNLQ